MEACNISLKMTKIKVYYLIGLFVFCSLLWFWLVGNIYLSLYGNRRWTLAFAFMLFVLYSIVCIVLDMSHYIRDWSQVLLRDDILRHTFHLHIREMIIALQDVIVALRLRIHGPPITNICDLDLSLLWYEHLDVTSLVYEIRGLVISTRWLCY